MTTSDRYPSREELATRLPPEMVEGADLDSTALDRPRFVDEVPHTRDHSLDGFVLEPRKEPSLPSYPDEPASDDTRPPRAPLLWLTLLLLSVLGGLGGTALGLWLWGDA